MNSKQWKLSSELLPFPIVEIRYLGEEVYSKAACASPCVAAHALESILTKKCRYVKFKALFLSLCKSFNVLAQDYKLHFFLHCVLLFRH